MNVTSIISPLPWENGTGHITDAKGDGIAQCFRPLYGDKDDNAAFIVKAVNAHDKLVEALKLAQKTMEKFETPGHGGSYPARYTYANAFAVIDAALAAAGEQV